MSAKTPNLVQAFALARPAHPLIQDDVDMMTGHDFAGQVARAADGLQVLGIQPGDVVAMLGAPGLTWHVLMAAGWTLGAQVAPLNHRAPAGELQAQILQLRAQHLVYDDKQDVPDDLLAVVATMPFATVFAAARKPVAWTSWEMHQPMLHLLTSGTTGEPSVVELTLEQMLFSAFGAMARLGHHTDDCWLNVLPENHVAALAIFFRCLVGQVSMRRLPRYDAEATRALLDSGDVTMVSLVPTMLQQVLDVRPDRPFHPNLRVVLLGGAACDQELLARCGALQVPVALTWGASETASHVATRFAGDTAPLEEGYPLLPFAQVTADPDGVVVHGPLAADGEVLLADEIQVRDDGRLQVLGRRDEVIIRGGENITPAEIEAVLQHHPEVAAVVVVPRADAQYGQVPVAVVEPAKESRPEPDALATWCRTHLAGHKIPEIIIAAEPLPRSALGKIRRGEIRAMLEETP